MEPVAGVVRGAAERTADVLRAVGKLVALELPGEAPAIADAVATLVTRLEHGVEREATALMQLGLRIRRAAARDIVSAGIASPDALVHAVQSDDPRVVAIVGAQQVRRWKGALARRSGHSALAVSRARAARTLFDTVGDATAI